MKHKLIFLILVFFLFIINFFIALLGVKIQFLTIGIINFIFSLYLLKINPYERIGWILIFIYPILGNLLLIHSLIFNVDSYRGLLIDIVCSLSSIFAIFTHTLKNKRIFIIIIYSIIYLLLSINFDNLFNYYLDEVQNEGNTNVKFPVINLEDENANLIEFPKGKVLVIDLWTSNCLYCIESFPEFEELKKQYKNDKEVDFLSINIYKTQNEKERSLKYLKKFTFNNYYHDFTLFNKLNFNSVPNYVVINKKGDITYFGSLNTGKFETFNNIHEIIKKSK